MNSSNFTEMGVASLGSTSSSLLGRVRTRDPEAWRRLVKLYAPAVYLWGRRSNLGPHDAADVVQETFLAVALHLERFRKDRPQDTFRGWLWSIARNKIRDHFRRRRNDGQVQGGQAAEDAMADLPEQSAASGVQPDAIGGLVERLALDLIRMEFEPHTWQAFWQTTVEGRLAVEVAAELSMTKRAVRQAKYRVLRRLRLEMDGLLE